MDAIRLETFIRDAAAQCAELVVTPETCFYRYDPWEQDGVTMLDLAKHYHELKDRFSALADELDISLVIGLREPSGDREKPVYNIAQLIDAVSFDRFPPIKKDKPIYIQLSSHDHNRGPSPYETTIVIHPSCGKLSGAGNDQTYTPVKRYTGSDVFTWKVNGGAEDSEIASVYITIEP